MELGVQVQRPVFHRNVFQEKSSLKIKPFIGSFSHARTTHFASLPSWSTQYLAGGIPFKITASSDFSRRRQRKMSSARSRGPPKGFTPKTPLGTDTQKRELKNEKEKEGSLNPTSSETVESNETTFEIETESDEDEFIEQQQKKELYDDKLEVSSTENYQLKENGKLTGGPKDLTADEAALEGRQVGSIKNDGVVEVESSSTVDKINEDATLKSKVEIEEKLKKEELKKLAEAKLRQEENERLAEEKLKKEELKKLAEAKLRQEENERLAKEKLKKEELERLAQEKLQQEEGERLAKEKLKKEELERLAQEKLQQEENERLAKEKLKKEELERLAQEKLQQEENERLAKEKLKKEELERLAQEKLQQEENERLAKEKLRTEEIEKLAEENFSSANRLFVYPQSVKPDEDIEVFYNRSFSSLSDEPDVLIMGAFNDWKWKSFTVRLYKSQLEGDWWSCLLHIPKEAYKMDFVFFNGQNVYDNNENKDFCVPVEGGMDAFAFEDFLLEEKRREQEQLAKEQAEKKRQEEEQIRREAEKAAREADRAQAKVETKKRREMLQQLLKRAQSSVDGVWHIQPNEFKGGDLIRLYYNKNSGPLAHANELWIHGGYNSWRDGLSISERLVRSKTTDDDWWYANVIVPNKAFVLDWVIADGPPQGANVYDNNKRQDFHAIVPKNVPDESFWAEEEHRIYEKLQEERRLREEAMRVKAEKTAQMKAETKERTIKRFLLSQKHVVYTEPLDVRAGSTATVFYNPANTVLNGKPEIWFRYSFNHWTHRSGSSLQKMLPTESGPHVKATVKVPLDAYLMDFVFSEREDGGVFDNKDGMDYHLPVFGGIAKEPPMHIVHIAFEMAPIAKVGGLGDVVTSLSRAVQDLNHSVDIILPKYDCLNVNHVKDLQYQQSYQWGGVEIKVWSGKVEGLSVYFLEPQNGMFWTGCIYGCRNDGERFGFFCHAALEFLLQSGFHPDILHCHDWSSAPVAWLYKEQYRHYGLSKARVVFTIHNLEFGAGNIGKAMAYSDKATTVSPTYAREVAGNSVVATHHHKFHGILNGIDPDIWDPYNDKFLSVHYTSENVVEGKRAAKQALQQRLGLKHTADLPVVGIITRLTHQKGIHLIKHAIWRTIERGGQVVLLGSAPDPRIQNDFVNFANHFHSAHNDRARLVLTYDEPLSHLIYAGADFILVPSIFEPCGLTQLTAMRYGSIPVVRKTGGLYDTVFDVDHDKERAEAQGLEPNGFSFDGADDAGVDYALRRAISAFYDGREWFDSLRKRVMEQDWSWNKPALDYMELYHAARKLGD